MTEDCPSLGEQLLSDRVASLDAGSVGDSSPEMFYYLNTGSRDGSTEKWWSQPIPEALTRVEGEYYALVKGLIAASDEGYTKAVVSTNSVQILDHLYGGDQPSPRLKPLYERANDLREQFNSVDLILYDS